MDENIIPAKWQKSFDEIIKTLNELSVKNKWMGWYTI